MIFLALHYTECNALEYRFLFCRKELRVSGSEYTTIFHFHSPKREKKYFRFVIAVRGTVSSWHLIQEIAPKIISLFVG